MASVAPQKDTPGAGVPAGLPGAPSQSAVPPELVTIEHLTQISQLYVQQRIDWLEMFADYDVSNTYEVFLSKEQQDGGQRWLLAKEESSCFQRICWRHGREFTLDVGLPGKKQPGQSKTFEEKMGLVPSSYVYPAVRVHRPCFCCLQQFAIQDGRGNQIAHGKEKCLNLITCCPLKIDVWRGDDSGDADYVIEGPSTCWIGMCMTVPCRKPFDFDAVEVKTGRTVGQVSNVPNGCCKMCFTSADNYVVTFDASATPQERGWLMAQSFLLDFRYFEAKQQKQNHGM
eukprot:TRINITY_DN56885_c0_g1_i1.p1 TRINITY_DN56885_c0_g1~~TRINITY_DN56885_c0_g1_i1.p1  ORF type:complete len:312 (+),score=48.19 TRINITY_DN56885_c0_g1_i1:82-936(+)